MLCRNCGRNDATIHLKRIINGEATEINLCSVCGKALGITDGFPVFLPVSGFSGSLFSERGYVQTGVVCEKCGFTFDDIVRTGMPGCPECYRVFGDKLASAVRKIHGRSKYCGKIPGGADEETRREHKINLLKAELNAAIDEQNFERAALLRDEIRRIIKEG